MTLLNVKNKGRVTNKHCKYQWISFASRKTTKPKCYHIQSSKSQFVYTGGVINRCITVCIRGLSMEANKTFSRKYTR